LREKARSFWGTPEFVNATKGGVRASTRIPLTLKMGREIFKT